MKLEKKIVLDVREIHLIGKHGIYLMLHYIKLSSYIA